MRTYDIKKVTITIAEDGMKHALLCLHPDGFEDEPAAEATSKIIATCGQAVYNIINDESMSLTINLIYGSSEDKLMEMLYLKQKTIGFPFYFTIIITDYNINQEIIYYNCVFMKRKAHKYANESGTEAQKWELFSEKKIVYDK